MRLFIACPIPEEMKKKIENTENLLKGSGADVRWVKPENLHLTLKFLGEVKEEKIPSIIEKIPHAIEGITPFHAEITNLGVFPNWRRIRVVWLGFEKGKKELEEISKRIEEKMSHLGFEKEKRTFTAHLTIGRVKSNRNINELIKMIHKERERTFEEIFIEHVMLMQSNLRPEGAIYTCLEKFNLGKMVKNGTTDIS